MSDILSAKFQLNYGTFNLDVDLALPTRGVIALFGHSGCGKTTVLRCTAGLERALGHLRINGHVWQDQTTFVPTHKRALAYVFQEASLFPHLSVRRNLDYGRRRIPVRDRVIELDQVVQWLGLEGLLNRSPAKLSGGERQRVAIARALLTSPRLLLMDEPLSALDYQSRNEIMPYLEYLRDQLSIPILYVTHSPDEVARLADHLVLMDAGRVQAQGPLTETLARLDTPIRQEEDAGVAFAAKVVERDTKWHLMRAEFPGGSMWVRDNGAVFGKSVRLRILARDVSLGYEPMHDGSILNVLPATVTETRDGDHPAIALARLELGGTEPIRHGAMQPAPSPQIPDASETTPLIARLTARSAAALDLKPGTRLYAHIKSAAVLE